MSEPSITRAEMMGMILQACPSFTPEWETFLREWENDPGPPPLYGALGGLARHMVHLLERGEVEPIKRVFVTVTEFLTRGDEYVREAAIAGLLEGLQNTSAYTSRSSADFVELMTPECRTSWDELNRAWQALSDARAEDE